MKKVLNKIVWMGILLLFNFKNDFGVFFFFVIEKSIFEFVYKFEFK